MLNNNPDSLNRHIVLITSGQPTLNPRLVKEADALAEAGYRVTVVYQYWNDWGTKYDITLLAGKKWKALRVGGTPDENRYIYLFTRALYKLFKGCARTFGFQFGIAELAIGRCTRLLYQAAVKHPAELYIAHNLAALPSAYKAARQNRAKCGFDMEDYHRNETSDDSGEFDVKLKTYIEEKYIPLTDYLTASSKHIAERYRLLFPLKKITTILNVFPRNPIGLKLDNSLPLKLFWFSQSIGLNRGIEDVIKAIRLLEGEAIEFHIAGQITKEATERLSLGVSPPYAENKPAIFYHEPVNPERLVSFAASFDIGLALEPGFSANNDSALSNKIFTYVSAGLALIASSTTAQKNFMDEFPFIGAVYTSGDFNALAIVIKKYIDHRNLLNNARKASYETGQKVLNWEKESGKFLNIIRNTLSQ